MFKRTLLALLTTAVVVLAFGTAYAGSAPTANGLIYGYYSVRGATNLMTVVQTTTACAIPAPAFKQAFTYTPVVDPVVTCDADTSKPIGVGDIAHGNLDIAVDVGPFEEPVDVSFGLFNASFDASNIFFLNVFNQVTSLQDELADDSSVPGGNGQNNPPGQPNGKKNFRRLIPWKSNVLEVHDTIASGDLTDLPPGLYVLVLNVTRTSPADNNFDRFYRWITYFIVPDSTQ
jgi:hypothetical protein